MSIDTERDEDREDLEDLAPEADDEAPPESGVFDSGADDDDHRDDDVDEAAQARAEKEREFAEFRARSMGWRPKEEWRGPPDQWKDATAFVKVADERAPLLRKEVEKLASDGMAMRRALQEMARNNRQLHEQLAQTQVTTLESQIRQAEELGDTKTVAELAQKLGEQRAVAQSRKQQAEAAERQQNTVNPDEIPAFRQWQARNPWYGQDQALTNYANTVAAQQAAQKYSPHDPEFYESATRMVAAYAAANSIPIAIVDERRAPAQPAARAQAGPQGESAIRRGTGSRVAKKGWNDIHPDERSIGRELIKSGAFKNEAEYAAAYWSE